jgi:hypothetical protein
MSSPEDIWDAAAGATQLCRTAGFTYPERYSNLEEVLTELTREGVGDFRALRAVAVACFLGRREVFDRERVRKEELLRRRRDPYLEQFRALCEFLDANWGAERAGSTDSGAWVRQLVNQPSR